MSEAVSEALPVHVKLCDIFGTDMSLTYFLSVKIVSAVFS